MSLLDQLLNHPHAPKWNRCMVDDISKEQISFVENYAEKLNQSRIPFGKKIHLDWWNWIKEKRKEVLLFKKNVPAVSYIDMDWESIPTTSREDIAQNLNSIVPIHANLKELFYFNTSGTTGHIIRVPHDVAAVSCYVPLIEFVLNRFGIRLDLDSNHIACFLVGYQEHTVTYAIDAKVWKGACFSKLNLKPKEWPSKESAQKYIEYFNPQLLTGDPISFAEMLKQDIHCSPKAMITTAVAMPEGLKNHLEDYYHCPVIDWYSLTETGPLGYYCPHGKGYHILPHDIFVEVLDSQGRRVPEGERGEITVTGGRNPFLPLLRYRTGDWGRINYHPCSCGDSMPLLETLEGRKPVLFRGENNSIINPVDISRILREFPIVQYEFKQLKDKTCCVTIRPISAQHPIDENRMKEKLREIFKGIPIQIELNFDLGEHKVSDKVIPYHSELLLDICSFEISSTIQRFHFGAWG